MRYFRRVFLFSTLSLLALTALCLSIWQTPVAHTQNDPLTYPEIITALNTKLPNQSFKNKTELINWLIIQIKQRKVDKPLTADREDDLRQAGATSQLIETIRANSPSSATPTPTPKLTPTPKTTPTPKPTPTPTSTRKPKEIKNSNGMEFVLIPSGSFMMGAPDAEKDRVRSETPQHRVNINYEFYLGKYEVTLAQWKAVMGDLPEGDAKQSGRQV
jgi:formylglycine-generating enzyme required for sulfatase activity